MKFTKRERVLLYILLCLVLVLGGVFFLILPSFEKYNNLKATHQTAELELESARASIIDYTDLDKQIKKTAKELKAIKNKFYAEMDKEEVDDLVTESAVNHNLVPTSLSISEVAKEDVVNFSDKGSKGSSMKVYTVTLNVQGSVENMQILVNDANKSKTMKVQSVSYSEQTTDEKDMVIVFKVFMI